MFVRASPESSRVIERHGTLYDALNDVPADIRGTVTKMGLKATADGEAAHVWADRMRTLKARLVCTGRWYRAIGCSDATR